MGHALEAYDVIDGDEACEAAFALYLHDYTFDFAVGAVSDASQQRIFGVFKGEGERYFELPIVAIGHRECDCIGVGHSIDSYK